MDYDSIADLYVKNAHTMPGNELYERPATKALLPDLAGLDVLDAGCGDGYYSEYMTERGARVVGYDPSAKMIEHARLRMNGKACELHACQSRDLPQILKGRNFDLILSALVLHYVEDLTSEFSHFRKAIRPEGRVVISMKHPLIHMGAVQRFGYRAHNKLRIRWDWVDGDVLHIQRPLGAITDSADAAGFYIDRLIEAQPLPEMKAVEPQKYEMAIRFPFFLHLVLRPRPLSD